MRSRWAWAKAMLDPDYGFTAEYARLRPRPAEFPPAVAAELQEIEDRLAQLEALPEDAWTDGLTSEAEDLQNRHDELTQTTEAEAVYTQEDRARAGVIVTIGDDGDFRLYEGLVERAARPAHAGYDATKTAEDGDAAFVSGADSAGPFPRPLTGEQQVREECGFSQVLVDDLKAHRLQIAKAHLAGDFGVAFDLALYSLCTNRAIVAIAPARSICGHRDPPSIFAERSYRYCGRSVARSARKGARPRLALYAGDARLRGARGITG